MLSTNPGALERGWLWYGFATIETAYDPRYSNGWIFLVVAVNELLAYIEKQARWAPRPSQWLGQSLQALLNAQPMMDKWIFWVVAYGSRLIWWRLFVLLRLWTFTHHVRIDWKLHSVVDEVITIVKHWKKICARLCVHLAAKILRELKIQSALSFV